MSAALHFGVENPLQEAEDRVWTPPELLDVDSPQPTGTRPALEPPLIGNEIFSGASEPVDYQRSVEAGHSSARALTLSAELSTETPECPEETWQRVVDDRYSYLRRQAAGSMTALLRKLARVEAAEALREPLPRYNPKESPWLAVRIAAMKLNLQTIFAVQGAAIYHMRQKAQARLEQDNGQATTSAGQEGYGAQPPAASEPDSAGNILRSSLIPRRAGQASGTFLIPKSILQQVQTPTPGQTARRTRGGETPSSSSAEQLAEPLPVAEMPGAFSSSALKTEKGEDGPPTLPPHVVPAVLCGIDAPQLLGQARNTFDATHHVTPPQGGPSSAGPNHFDVVTQAPVTAATAPFKPSPSPRLATETS